jgi:Domain of unknown function (DUF4167)
MRMPVSTQRAGCALYEIDPTTGAPLKSFVLIGSMLLKKDFEGVCSAILIQERHITGNIDPKNRLLGIKFAKVLPANEDHVSEWSFQFAHFATISRWTSGAARAEPKSSQNAQRNYERCLALARAEAQIGNTVGAENYYQYAEHYFRSAVVWREIGCPLCCVAMTQAGGEPGEHRTAPLEPDQHIISRSVIVLYVTTPQLTKYRQAAACPRAARKSGNVPKFPVLNWQPGAVGWHSNAPTKVASRREPIRVSAASLRRMSGERKYHASAFNPSRRIAEASAARRGRWRGLNDLYWL